LRGTFSYDEENALAERKRLSGVPRGADQRRAQGGQQPVRPGSISPARSAAFDILLRVETSAAHSDDLLHGAVTRTLSHADRNLATALVMGVLRWQIALDAELATMLDRPDLPLPIEIRTALRMGAFQLRHMDRIPAHAALSESVELVRAAGHPKAAGLVNAVLRKLSAKPARGRPLVESLDAAAARLGHPAWLVQRWDAAYGREAAVAICDYDQHEPRRGHLFGAEDAEKVDQRLIDDGSRLVAELAAVSHASPRRIWDACAAPGGKAAVLAERHPEAELLATDISARRLQAMRQRIEREMPERTVRLLQVNAAELPLGEGSFDLILCDVPCSGTGTLARNPEIRHRLQPSELERQAARQRQILGSAMKRLRAGGRLLYSTCSLETEENEAVVEAVLSNTAVRGNWRVVPMRTLIDTLRSNGMLRDSGQELAGLAGGDALRTLPGANFQGDGFFAVVFARES
jgi:16S rRNA (cytosine967-C5)-methyltransferase